MWLPNLALIALGIAATVFRAERRGRAVPRPLSEAAAAALPPSGRRARAAIRLPRSPLRLLSLVDRYVLARFLTSLALVLASAILISLVVDYADKLDEVARHHPSVAAVLGYYRYFLLSITIQIAPFAILLAALAGLGILSKNNEDTAFRASGVSLLRLEHAGVRGGRGGRPALLRGRRVHPAVCGAYGGALQERDLRSSGRYRHP